MILVILLKKSVRYDFNNIGMYNNNNDNDNSVIRKRGTLYLENL